MKLNADQPHEMTRHRHEAAYGRPVLHAAPETRAYVIARSTLLGEAAALAANENCDADDLRTFILMRYLGCRETPHKAPNHAEYLAGYESACWAVSYEIDIRDLAGRPLVDALLEKLRATLPPDYHAYLARYHACRTQDPHFGEKLPRLELPAWYARVDALAAAAARCRELGQATNRLRDRLRRELLCKPGARDPHAE
jgi:hypothetical protein